MARVPTLDQPEGNLKPTPIDARAAATLGGEVVDLSEGIGSIAEQIKKVQAITSENNAIKHLSDANTATHNKFQTDPGLDDASDRATQELDKNLQDSLDIIKDPEQRSRASTMLFKMRDSQETSLNNMIQGRVLAAGKASIRPVMDSFQRDYNRANSAEQEADIKNRANQWFDKQISGGHIKPEAAEDSREKMNYHFGVGKAINDIDTANDPRGPQEVVKKLDNGDYGDLNEMDYNHIKTRAERKTQNINVNIQRAARNIQERNARDLDYMLKTKNPNIQQHAEELYYTGQISKNTFENYTGKGKTPIVSPDTDGASYVEALAYIADPNTSVADVRNFIMDKYNQNLISPEDRNKLYDLAIRPYGKDYQSVKDVIGLQEAKKDEQDNWKRHLNASLDWIHNSMPFGKNLPDSYFGRADKNKNDERSIQMAKRFVKKLSEDTPAEQLISTAHEVVNEQRLLDRPEIAGYPEAGVMEQDVNGVRSLTRPNGSTQQEDDGSADNIDANY